MKYQLLIGVLLLSMALSAPICYQDDKAQISIECGKSGDAIFYRITSFSKETNKNAWLAIGFGESMEGAQMFICMRAGKEYVCNEYSSGGHGLPTLVGKDDITFIEGIVSPEQFATFSFSLKAPGVGEKIKIIWARGKAESPTKFGFH